MRTPVHPPLAAQLPAPRWPSPPPLSCARMPRSARIPTRASTYLNSRLPLRFGFFQAFFYGWLFHCPVAYVQDSDSLSTFFCFRIAEAERKGRLRPVRGVQSQRWAITVGYYSSRIPLAALRICITLMQSCTASFWASWIRIRLSEVRIQCFLTCLGLYLKWRICALTFSFCLEGQGRK